MYQYITGVVVESTYGGVNPINGEICQWMSSCGIAYVAAVPWVDNPHMFSVGFPATSNRLADFFLQVAF